MEQSPWKANRFSPSQGIPRILWNPKVRYHIYKCPPPVPILSQIEPAYAPTSHLLKIRSILSSHLRLGLQVVSFPQVSPPKPCIHLSSPNHTCYMTRQSHYSRYNHQNKIEWGVEIIRLLIMYFSPLPCYFVLLSPYILLSTPFSNTLSLRPSLNVSDQVSHPYKTTSKIIALTNTQTEYRNTHHRTSRSAVNSLAVPRITRGMTDLMDQTSRAQKYLLVE